MLSFVVVTKQNVENCKRSPIPLFKVSSRSSARPVSESQERSAEIFAHRNFMISTLWCWGLCAQVRTSWKSMVPPCSSLPSPCTPPSHPSSLDVSHCWCHWSVPPRQRPLLYIHKQTRTHKQSYIRGRDEPRFRHGWYACLSMCCERGMRGWPTDATRSGPV